MDTAMQGVIDFINKDIEMGMTKVKSGERIIWYIKTYFIDKEKQQIIDAYDCGKDQPLNSQVSPINYYNETFKP